MVLMTGAAFDGVDAVTVRATMNLHGVTVAVVTLTREVSDGVAVHATRVTEHWNDGFEGGCGCGIVTL
jgi:hypothetical protein